MMNAAYSESAALAMIQRGSNRHAEQLLRRLLVNQPDNVYARSLLAHALSGQQRHTEAEAAAREAIGLSPDYAYAHYTLAWVLFFTHKLAVMESAERSIREALRLEPTHSGYYDMLSRIYSDRKDWQKVADITADGLWQNPRDVNCLNSRAKALMYLERTTEAEETLNEALALEPENPLTHTTRGWLLLNQNQPYQALDHFYQALRRNPSLGWAHEGIHRAMEARNIVYRIFLAYFLWLLRRSRSQRLFILVGGFLVVARVHLFSEFYPQATPSVILLVLVYVVLVLLPLMGDPLADLLWQLDPFGPLAKSPDPFAGLKAAGVCLLIAAGLSGFGLLFPAAGSIFYAATLQTPLMIIPVAGLFRAKKSSLYGLFLGLTIFLALCIVVGLAAQLMGAAFSPDGTLIFAGMLRQLIGTNVSLYGMFLVGMLIYTWLCIFCLPEIEAV